MRRIPGVVRLRVEDVAVDFGEGALGRKRRRVLDGVSLSVAAGEVVAIVGESGSGKSTLARVICGLIAPAAGRVLVDGQPRAAHDRRVQLVFQDPFASLNPVHTVGHHLERPLALRGAPASSRARQAADLLFAVGLDPALAERRPHALSGGQRQRVAIARALAAQPEVLIADEPTSMLDVSTRADVLKLLRGLSDTRQLGVLVITHDLPSAAVFADRVLVLYAGRVVESGPTHDVLAAPAHPYTRLLLAAAPRADGGARPGDAAALQAAAAGVQHEPSDAGCPFAPRCPHVMPRCRRIAPQLYALQPQPAGDGLPSHHARCHLFTVEGANDAALP